MTNKKITYSILAISILTIVGISTTAYAGNHFKKFNHNKANWTSNFNIDSKQLKTDIKAGQTYTEALTNQNISWEDLLAQKKELMKEKLDALVAAGELTQEEANQHLEMFENKAFNKDKSKFHHKGFKQHHKKGNWHDYKK
jgi:polyhydroxyalkanoate synthesis regulator phasin